MIGQALSLLVQALNAATNNFDVLFASLPGAGTIFLAAFVVYLAVRFFLIPLVGMSIRSSLSDKVSKKGRGK